VDPWVAGEVEVVDLDLHCPVEEDHSGNWEEVVPVVLGTEEVVGLENWEEVLLDIEEVVVLVVLGTEEEVGLVHLDTEEEVVLGS